MSDNKVPDEMEVDNDDEKKVETYPKWYCLACRSHDNTSADSNCTTCGVAKGAFPLPPTRPVTYNWSDPGAAQITDSALKQQAERVYATAAQYHDDLERTGVADAVATDHEKIHMNCLARRDRYVEQMAVANQQKREMDKFDGIFEDLQSQLDDAEEGQKVIENKTSVVTRKIAGLRKCLEEYKEEMVANQAARSSILAAMKENEVRKNAFIDGQDHHCDVTATQRLLDNVNAELQVAAREHHKYHDINIAAANVQNALKLFKEDQQRHRHTVESLREDGSWKAKLSQSMQSKWNRREATRLIVEVGNAYRHTSSQVDNLRRIVEEQYDLVQEHMNSLSPKTVQPVTVDFLTQRMQRLWGDNQSIRDTIRQMLPPDNNQPVPLPQPSSVAQPAPPPAPQPSVVIPPNPTDEDYDYDTSPCPYETSTFTCGWESNPTGWTICEICRRHRHDGTLHPEVPPPPAPSHSSSAQIRSNNSSTRPPLHMPSLFGPRRATQDDDQSTTPPPAPSPPPQQRQFSMKPVYSAPTNAEEARLWKPKPNSSRAVWAWPLQGNIENGWSYTYDGINDAGPLRRDEWRPYRGLQDKYGFLNAQEPMGAAVPSPEQHKALFRGTEGEKTVRMLTTLGFKPPRKGHIKSWVRNGLKKPEGETYYDWIDNEMGMAHLGEDILFHYQAQSFRPHRQSDANPRMSGWRVEVTVGDVMLSIMAKWTNIIKYFNRRFICNYATHRCCGQGWNYVALEPEAGPVSLRVNIAPDLSKKGTFKECLRFECTAVYMSSGTARLIRHCENEKSQRPKCVANNVDFFKFVEDYSRRIPSTVSYVAMNPASVPDVDDAVTPQGPRDDEKAEMEIDHKTSGRRGYYKDFKPSFG